MAQKKFYIGEPIQRVLDSPNQPVFTSEHAANGYPDSVQLNRFVQRGLDALFSCIPDISAEAWRLIMNTIPCNDQEIDDLSLHNLKDDCMTMVGLDDFFEELLEKGIDDYENPQEAVEKHFQGENKDAIFEVLSLSGPELMGVREVVERFWSKRVYKRNHGFDMTLYDIKRSLVLKSCQELELASDSVRVVVEDLAGEIIGFRFREQYEFTHFINFSTKEMEKMDETKAFEDFLDGAEIDYLSNTFSLFGYQGTWEIFDPGEEPMAYEEESDYIIEIENHKFEISDLTPYPGEGSEEFWIGKIAKTIHESCQISGLIE
jgi:hypothetical protein